MNSLLFPGWQQTCALYQYRIPARTGYTFPHQKQISFVYYQCKFLWANFLPLPQWQLTFPGMGWMRGLFTPCTDASSFSIILKQHQVGGLTEGFVPSHFANDFCFNEWNVKGVGWVVCLSPCGSDHHLVLAQGLECRQASPRAPVPPSNFGRSWTLAFWEVALFNFLPCLNYFSFLGAPRRNLCIKPALVCKILLFPESQKFQTVTPAHQWI